MRMLRHISSVTVRFDFAPITDPGIGKIFNIIPYREHHLIGDKFLIHQTQNEKIRHLAHDELCLFEIIRTLQNLSTAQTVRLRLIGFDQLHGHRLIPPGMINQKLRIHTEHTVQQLLIVKLTRLSDRAARNIAHCIKARFLKLFCISMSYPPEVSQRPVVPQIFAVCHLIEKSNANTVLIRIGMLCHNIHRHFAQIQICTDTARRSNSSVAIDFHNDL